ncbi:MAG: chloride channel protein [Planctomycetota bacterium]
MTSADRPDVSKSMASAPETPARSPVQAGVQWIVRSVTRSITLAPSGKWAILALFVGLLVGLGCIALEFLTQAIGNVMLTQLAGFSDGGAVAEHRFFSSTEEFSDPSGFSPSWLLVSLAAGGLLSGWLVYTFAPEAAGAGTDAAADAFHNHKGMVRRRVVWVKTMASAITLGTGGSAGREGPIAQIGAGIGSAVADRLKLSPRDRRILLAAGMGAGVGAMFRAPLAGAIFAGEILYSDADMEADVLVPAAVASIVAYSVYTQSIPVDVRYQPIFGDQLQHSLGSPLELWLYLALGLVLFALAIVYTQMFHTTVKLFGSLSVPPLFRPVLGAVLAGGVGIAAYWAGGSQMATLGVLGTGYGTLQHALVGDGTLTITALMLVAAAKMVTSSLSVGSGGSGGVFGPSMVIGGCGGAAFGHLMHQLAPEMVPHPETFGVVGMAGFFAGVARAPISTIIMIRELTGDFGLLVPTMLVCAFTFVASSRWRLYKKQVSTRLESPAHRGDFLIDVLEGLEVEDVYRKNLDMMMIYEGETLDQIVHHLAESHQHYFPVVDAEGKMIGIFSDDDVRAYLYDQTIWHLANAGDVMTSPFVNVSPDEDLNTAMQKFTSLNLDELPVISPDRPGELLGFLRRKELIAAYNRRLVEHRRIVEQE